MHLSKKKKRSRKICQVQERQPKSYALKILIQNVLKRGHWNSTKTVIETLHLKKSMIIHNGILVERAVSELKQVCNIGLTF